MKIGYTRISKHEQNELLQKMRYKKQDVKDALVIS
jgi:hypothetical protein